MKGSRIERGMSLEDAIADLRAKYIEALDKGWINNPLAWALYEVWKKAEGRVK